MLWLVVWDTFLTPIMVAGELERSIGLANLFAEASQGLGQVLVAQSPSATPLNSTSDLGPFTVGSGSYHVISNPFMNSNTRCFVQPGNQLAAAVTGAYISTSKKSCGQRTLYHATSQAGAIFEVWCHQ